jgi:hypothetical protein
MGWGYCPSRGATLTGEITAPFPYTGGKRRIAATVWEALGNPYSYIEPFGGSLAVLLAAPRPAGFEVVNDSNHFVTNFWRAIRDDWRDVLDVAQDPVTEADFKARHLWLMTEGTARLQELDMVRNPFAYDPLVAGWWAWGQSLAIWQWCLPGADGTPGAMGGLNQRPDVRIGKGILTSTPQEIQRLAARLRHVRVLCGDWKRALGNGVLLLEQRREDKVTAVFLDPPYRPHMRDPNAYGAVDETKAPLVDNDTVEAWCRGNGSDPRLRIVLAGLEGEYELPGWRQVAWKAPQANPENRDAERLWLSPHCLTSTTQEALF